MTMSYFYSCIYVCYVLLNFTYLLTYSLTHSLTYVNDTSYRPAKRNQNTAVVHNFAAFEF